MRCSSCGFGHWVVLVLALHLLVDFKTLLYAPILCYGNEFLRSLPSFDTCFGEITPDALPTGNGLLLFSGPSKRRDTRASMDFLRTHGHSTFAGEPEFIERAIQTFLIASNNPQGLLMLVGDEGLGKQSLARLFAHSMYSSPRTEHVNTETWPDFSIIHEVGTNDKDDLCIISKIREKLTGYPSGVFVGLRNIHLASELDLSGLKTFFKSEEWQSTGSVVALLEDLDAELPGIRLTSSMDLNDAYEVLKEVVEESKLGEMIDIGGENLYLIPFIPKSTRVLEMQLSRLCDLHSFVEAGITLVCDPKTIAQAAIKLEPCMETVGFRQSVLYFYDAFKIALSRNAFVCAGKTQDCEPIKEGIALAIDVGETGACSADGIQRWIDFHTLDAF